MTPEPDPVYGKDCAGPEPFPAVVLTNAAGVEDRDPVAKKIGAPVASHASRAPTDAVADETPTKSNKSAPGVPKMKTFKKVSVAPERARESYEHDGVTFATQEVTLESKPNVSNEASQIAPGMNAVAPGARAVTVQEVWARIDTFDTEASRQRHRRHRDLIISLLVIIFILVIILVFKSGP